mmetsp:Transcript_14672/g.33067  ORF Transcript_14672/g.33067 Transcript_14672/m.33067 type:complete len:300 (+) Transcript_14672:2-901(+)
MHDEIRTNDSFDYSTGVIKDNSNKRKADALTEDPDYEKGKPSEILSQTSNEHIQSSNGRLESLSIIFNDHIHSSNERSDSLSNILNEHIKSSLANAQRLEDMVVNLEGIVLSLSKKIDHCNNKIESINGQSPDEEEEDLSDDDESVVDNNDRWSIMFQGLRAYRITNGHCKVGQNENAKLYVWLKNQRTFYTNLKTGKHGLKLSNEKVIKLDSLGLHWGQKFPPPPSWDDMFEELKSYKERMGSCNVPTNPTHPTSLAKWVSYQRREYKRFRKDRDTLITLDQIGLLKDLGLKWKGPKL